MMLASWQTPSGACTVAVVPGHRQTSITLFFKILVSQPCTAAYSDQNRHNTQILKL